jgi:hypothetical protein
MIARRRVLVLTPAMLLGLSACGGPEVGSFQPRTELPALALTVGEVEVDESYPPLADANFIDERRTKRLATVAAQQLRQRITATGGVGRARVTLDRASITERLLADRSGGVTGFVTREPTYDMAGDLAVRVTILDSAGIEQAIAKAGVGRSRTVRAGASVMDRDAEAQRLMGDLLAQLDDALPKAMRDNLGSWIAG